MIEPRPARSILRRLPDLNAMRSNAMRRKPGSGVSSAGVLLRPHRLLIGFILVTALVASQDATRPTVPDPRVVYNAALVVPYRVEDIPNLTPEFDKFPELDNFAWRAFVALNWPALTDPAHRGFPDRAKTPGDPGPRVWETFKARYELFQVGPDGSPLAPEPWATLRGGKPCGNGGGGWRENPGELRAVQGFQSIRRLGHARQSTGGAESHLYPLRNPPQRTGVLGA